jgi:glutamate synthase (NADPH/NADH) small chain
MDCVRTAVRQGAASVKCLYRRDRPNMPGSMREVTHAEEEGVEFVWLSAPEALLGNGTVSAVRARRIRLGVPDGTGRQVPEAVPESSFTVGADLVVLALGFDPEDMSTMLGTSAINLTHRGTIQADFTTLATSLDDVFAAGDIIRGASLVVWAIRDGREASESIHTYLRAQTAGRGRAETGGVSS